MTQSVVPKTSIPEKTWRRQTDSPTWWIAFSCGSVILHLLAFWFISSYRFSVSQSSSGSAVPIEFVEISPEKSSSVQPKSQPKPKAVSPKPAPVKPIIPQNSQQSVKPPVSTVDRDAISFNNQKIEQQLAEQQRYSLLQQQKLAEQQRQLEIEQQRQLELEQQRLRAEELRQRQQQQEDLEAQIRQQEQKQQQELDEKLRQEEAEQQRQLEIQKQQEAEQRELARKNKQEAEEQRKLATAQQSQNPPDGERILDGPKNADGEEPPPEFDKKTAQAPIQNQPNQSGGILTASWKIDTKTFKEKPTNLAQPLKRINSDIPLPPPQNGNFQPGSFLVWLIIDNQGNLISVEVDKQIPLAQRSQYQEYAEKIFNGQKFIPASESNGSKPPLSYLPIIIKIQQNQN